MTLTRTSQHARHLLKAFSGANSQAISQNEWIADPGTPQHLTVEKKSQNI